MFEIDTSKMQANIKEDWNSNFKWSAMKGNVSM